MSDFSVEKVAQLAYLELPSADQKSFAEHFQKILQYVDQLQEVPMTPEEAKAMGSFHTTTAFYELLKLDPSVTLRDEAGSEATQSLVLKNEEALQNAPRTGGIPGELLFEVPSIIERSN